MNRFAWLPRALVAMAIASSARAEVPVGNPEGGPDPSKKKSGVVLIVRSPGDDRVVARVRAELSSSGWQCVELTPDPREAGASLASLSSVVSAAAAVRTHTASGSIDVWVAASENATEIASAGPHPDDRMLALRATEALRALGLRLEPHAPEPNPEPRPAAEPTAARAPEREPDASGARSPGMPGGIWLSLAPATALTPGGWGPALDGSVDVRVEHGVWSAGVLTIVPVTGRRIAGAEGDAQVSTFVAGVFGEVGLHRAPWQMNAGLGLGAAIARMNGTARAGYASSDETVVVAAPFTRLSCRLEVGHGWRVFAGAMLGTAAPRVSVQFIDREVATWGRPFFFVGAIGVDTALLTWGRSR